jgi:hypothetical protein
MTITISRQAYDELLYQQTVERSQHPDSEDLLDVIYQFPPALGQGYWREIQLREGLELTIANLQLRDRLMTKDLEGENCLRQSFRIDSNVDC